MFHQIDDLRIEKLRPLIAPAILMEDLPLTEKASATIAESRERARRIIAGEDDRLLVVVGPCSIHETTSALEYARRLQEAQPQFEEDLHLIMRVYFEKPRTTIGWKGLINDPTLDHRFEINRGLRKARELLLTLAESGLPAGTEFLDTIIPQFIADLISWGAIGARTTESQVHRELASGLSMPVGFKNGTSGNTQIAVDAVRAAKHPHCFLSVTKQGISAIVETKGNDSCHIILRGGSRTGTNFDPENVAAVSEQLDAAGITTGIMIDCSHGNSQKDHHRQAHVAHAVAEQVSRGSRRICGIMIESHLQEGREDYRAGAATTFGRSITDACISWEQTRPLLEDLAKAARERRSKKS